MLLCGLNDSDPGMVKMLQIIAYDTLESISKKIMQLPFWNQLEDAVFCGCDNDIRIENAIMKHEADVLICMIRRGSFAEADFARKILSNYSHIPVIIISKELEYEKVRHAFLLGAFDYIPYDGLEQQLYLALKRIPNRKRDSYFSDKIYDKVQVLIKHIFNAGNNVEEIVHDIVDCIYLDWGSNGIDCQQVIARVKLESYKSFVRIKPWLEKFIYRGDYIRDTGFDLKDREATESELFRFYSEVNILFKKYNVIDVSKTIYSIGKCVIRHVDEKVNLDSVAKEVYLNRTYISHIFKEMTNVSFNNFVLDVKIERAKTLLHYPDMSVSNVASMLCFCNEGYFGAKFKCHTGMTPLEYKKCIKS